MKQRVYEGALNFLRGKLKKLKEKSSGSVKEREMLEVVKAAIERQISIKAISPKTYDGYACPRCGHHFEKKPYYCHNCGQHINYIKSEKDEIVTHDNQVVINASLKDDNTVILAFDNTNLILDAHALYHVIMDNKSAEIKGTFEYKEYK